MFRRVSTHRRLLRVGLTSIAFALLALHFGASVALAHSNLERSAPADGETIPKAPADVRLWFSEDLEPQFSRAVVYDGNRHPVSTASQVASENPRLLVVQLASNLPRGWYVVTWQAQAKLDGHFTRGSFTFGIGVTGPPPGVRSAARAAENGSGSLLEITLRWLILLSTIVIVGSFAFWLLQSRALLDELPSKTRVRITPGQWAIAELAWLLFMFANVIYLTNAAAIATDASSIDDLGPPLVLLATQTTFGQLWLVRMALASILGIILLYRGNNCPSRWDGPAVLLGGGLLLSFSLTSHSAAVRTLAVVAVANDWLHFAAVTIWVGGLIQLSLVFSGASGSRARSDSSIIRRALVRRFSAVATYALAIVVVTGFFEGVYHVATADNLVQSPYGRVVLLKTLLVVPLVTLGALHHWLIRPALIRGDADKLPRVVSRIVGTKSLDAWFSRSIRFEALWAVLIIAVVGLLTSLSPP